MPAGASSAMLRGALGPGVAGARDPAPRSKLSGSWRQRRLLHSGPLGGPHRSLNPGALAVLNSRDQPAVLHIVIEL